MLDVITTVIDTVWSLGSYVIDFIGYFINTITSYINAGNVLMATLIALLVFKIISIIK